MYITRQALFEGCLLSSLAHAIMVSVYPYLSHEQSWDGMNFSIQDSQGMRGTLTFAERFCVGAFRNEENGILSTNNYNGKVRKELLSTVPNDVIEIAENETFQYLLIDCFGSVIPNITSFFWCDTDGFYYLERLKQQLGRDMNLLYNILKPRADAEKALCEYYDMNESALNLLNHLFDLKINNFSKTIYLSEQEKQMFPAEKLNDECRESLKELNIFVTK